MPSLLGPMRGIQKGAPDVNSRMKRKEVNFNVGGPPTVSENATEEMPV